MYRIMEDGNGYSAVFVWNEYGKFWQQYSKWYFRKGYAKLKLQKIAGIK